MNNIKNFLRISLAIFLAIFVINGTNLAYADNAQDGLKSGFEQVTGEKAEDSEQNIESIIQKVVDIILYFTGTLSIIMIIYGGFKYTTSGGDAGKVGEAKKTITYAVIGVIISLLAYGIINFVIGELTK